MHTSHSWVELFYEKFIAWLIEKTLLHLLYQLDTIDTLNRATKLKLSTILSVQIHDQGLQPS